jgi:type II secretory pathway pseudopilin PulG
MAGMALVEIIVAMSLLALVIVSSTQAFIQANRESAAMRLMTAARGIVQRNIDTALTAFNIVRRWHEIAPEDEQPYN